MSDTRPPLADPAGSAELEALLRRAAGRRAALDPDGVRRLWWGHRATLRRLAEARTSDDPRAVRLALAANALVHRPAGPAAGSLSRALAHDLPVAVRRELAWVLLAAAIYGVAGALLGAAAATSRVWRRALLPAALRAGLRAQLRAGVHPTHGPAASLVVMLFFHNVLASAVAYAGGLLAGVGSVVALVANAALVGSLAGWMTAHGASVAFWALIVPHGALELPATFCAGGGGLAAGAAWFRPGERGRLEAMAAALRRTAPLFGVCVAWLVGAALLEGLFTPQPLPPIVKIGSGAALFAALVLWLAWPQPVEADPPPTPQPAPRPAPPDPPLQPLLDARRRDPAPRSPTTRTRSRRPDPPSQGPRLPEGLRLGLPPASVPSRAVALTIDLAVWTAVLALPTGAAASVGLRPGHTALLALGAVWATGAAGLYWFVWEWLGGGITPGKRLLGLAVLLEDGRPPGFTPALTRNLLRLIDALPAAYLLGATVAIGSGGRRLGDWVAGTQVVHLPGLARAPRHPRQTLPLPRPLAAGPLPPPATLTRLPRRLRRRILRLWARVGPGPQDPPGVAATLADAATALGRPGLITLPPKVALEHIAAALERGGLARAGYVAGVPRDRSSDLGPRRPAPAACDRLPPELATALAAYWRRQGQLLPGPRAELVRDLAARAVVALDAPGLDADDPDALVEHLVWLLQSLVP